MAAFDLLPVFIPLMAQVGPKLLPVRHLFDSKSLHIRRLPMLRMVRCPV